MAIPTTPFAQMLSSALFDEGDDALNTLPAPPQLDPAGGVPSHLLRQQQAQKQAHAAWLGQLQQAQARDNSDPNTKLALAGAEALEAGMPKAPPPPPMPAGGPPMMYPGQAYKLSDEELRTWMPPKMGGMQTGNAQSGVPGAVTAQDLYERERASQRASGINPLGGGILTSTRSTPESRGQLMAEMAPLVQQFRQQGTLPAPQMAKPSLTDRIDEMLARRTAGNPEFALLMQAREGVDRNAALARQAEADMMRGEAAKMQEETLAKSAPIKAMIEGKQVGLDINPQFRDLFKNAYGIDLGTSVGSNVAGPSAAATETAKSMEKSLGPAYKDIQNFADRIGNQGIFGARNRPAALADLQKQIAGGVLGPDAMDAVINELYAKKLVDPYLAGDIKTNPKLAALKARFMTRPEWAKSINEVREVPRSEDFTGQLAKMLGGWQTPGALDLLTGVTNPADVGKRLIGR